MFWNTAKDERVRLFAPSAVGVMESSVSFLFQEQSDFILSSVSNFSSELWSSYNGKMTGSWKNCSNV